MLLCLYNYIMEVQRFMGYAYLIGLILMTVGSLVFSLLAFIGKDIILDDTYIKASKEEREKMNKKAYRQQGGIIFLFLFAISLCNTLRAVLHIATFTYIAWGFAVVGIIYAITSHYTLKKKY